ncbi:unnamed protein product [Penicillium salamii]|nr:unnamed protein product [Penicillium salamii]CAG8318528.1 unnamed protein product [Penicillium salamii]
MFRPALSKWISRPSEVLYRTTFNNIQSRAPRSLLAQTQAQAFRRTLTTGPTRSRPTPSSLLPKQRPNRRYNSGSSNGQTGQTGRTEKASLSDRLKKLSREYGWAALGVYLALSALDFPFCFAAVRLLGVERIGHYEHVVVSFVKDKFKAVWPTTEESEGQGKLVEAEERNKDEASIWTQLVFAYAIHKSFIFIRVPLTAAILPKVVKTLRGWGWNIGKRKPKST